MNEIKLAEPVETGEWLAWDRWFAGFILLKNFQLESPSRLHVPSYFMIDHILHCSNRLSLLHFRQPSLAMVGVGGKVVRKIICDMFPVPTPWSLAEYHGWGQRWVTEKVSDLYWLECLHGIVYVGAVLFLTASQTHPAPAIAWMLNPRPSWSFSKCVYEFEDE